MLPTIRHALSAGVTIWTTCLWGPEGACIQRRTRVTGGFSYLDASNGIMATDRALFIPPLVMDPVTDNAVLRHPAVVSDGERRRVVDANFRRSDQGIRRDLDDRRFAQRSEDHLYRHIRRQRTSLP